MWTSPSDIHSNTLLRGTNTPRVSLCHHFASRVRASFMLRVILCGYMLQAMFNIFAFMY